jgi:hypothetical protein
MAIPDRWVANRLARCYALPHNRRLAGEKLIAVISLRPRPQLGQIHSGKIFGEAVVDDIGGFRGLGAGFTPSIISSMGPIGTPSGVGDGLGEGVVRRLRASGSLSFRLCLTGFGFAGSSREMEVSAIAAT